MVVAAEFVLPVALYDVFGYRHPITGHGVPPVHTALMIRMSTGSKELGSI